MGRTVMLVENLANTRLFTGHSIDGNEEASGREAFRVASGRRTQVVNYWTPTTENSEATLTITFDRVRAFDMVALDRGHNLSGYQVVCEYSFDGFTTSTEAFDVTLPSTSRSPARLSESPGVLTREGAWLYRPGSTFIGKAVRLRIPAMGAGLRPRIVGLDIGMSFRPDIPRELPLRQQGELTYQLRRSPQGVVAATDYFAPDVGEVAFKYDPGTEQPEQGLYHIDELYRRGRKPMWLVDDEDQAELARRVTHPPGRSGRFKDPSWSEWQIDFPYIELDPKRVF